MGSVLNLCVSSAVESTSKCKTTIFFSIDLNKEKDKNISLQFDLHAKKRIVCCTSILKVRILVLFLVPFGSIPDSNIRLERTKKSVSNTGDLTRTIECQEKSFELLERIYFNITLFINCGLTGT